MALEIVHLGTEGEFVVAQCAIDNVLAVPFLFHKAVREDFPNELAFFNYLERQAKGLIEQYGDARKWPDQGFTEVSQGAIA